MTAPRLCPGDALLARDGWDRNFYDWRVGLIVLVDRFRNVCEGVFWRVDGTSDLIRCPLTMLEENCGGGSNRAWIRLLLLDDDGT